MGIASAGELAARKCLPCEGGVDPLAPEQAAEQLRALSGWTLTHEGRRIRKEWVVKSFLAGIRFFNAVAELAEAEEHHPDLHLSGYRNVAIEIWTHALGGLSENDLILAAKIDLLPVETRK